MTKIEMSKILAFIDEFSGRPMTDVVRARARLGAWMTMWGQVEGDLLLEAVILALKKDSNPRSQLIESSLKTIRETEEGLTPPVEIWERLRRKARAGVSESELFRILKNYPRVLRAVKAIGWDRIRFANIETELPWVRKEFLAAFEQIREGDYTKESLAQIPPHVKSLTLRVSASKGLPGVSN